jgi:acyl-homoserine lactone acylase PvdQ
MYVGAVAQAEEGRDIARHYKDSSFGQMPGGVESVTVPRPGVEIARDRSFGMAHVTGATRSDVMFGAGYATAQERLFMMDVLRRTATGRLAALTGPSAAGDDAAQLTDQDFSAEEYQAQVDRLPERFGPEGAQGRQDILDYVAGINARIADVRANPLQLPAEYAALGAPLEDWTAADTVALATLLVTQFTVSNGSEEVNAQLQLAFRERFGKRWRGPYRDLRMAEDPEAFVMAKRVFRSDRTGRVRRGRRNLIPDLDSIERRNPLVEGPGAARQRRLEAGQPPWVRAIERVREALPDTMSNAVMVGAGLASEQHPIAAMGPQVSYFSPQIFVEYELHGGGIDVSGVTFPGASPYPLIGHGIDFAWSGTSANGDNQDTFVEVLCEPDGAAPTRESSHYRYRGECRPFTSREQVVQTPFSPLTPDVPPTTLRYRTLRSVHGPVFATATVRGEPVALAKAKGVNFRELDGLVPFKRVAENAVTDARSFRRAFSSFPGTENWFYVDDRSVAVLQSGRFPLHRRGSDLDLPFRGDGPGDWRGFDPETYEYRALANRRRPTVLDPADGFIISWNNKEALGWRKGPTEWADGPVHRALMLRRRLREAVRAGGGKVDLVGLTRAVNLAASTDLRGDVMFPWLRRVIGEPDSVDAPWLALLEEWHRSGGKRLDADGDNLYDHSAAVALMDAWWPLLVREMFQPALGRELFERVEGRVLQLDDDWGWKWASHVQKDLRTVLGRRVRGRFSRVYCGGPASTPLRGAARRRVRARCRAVLVRTLREAVAAVSAERGADPSAWRVEAVCDSGCDQIEPTTAGAVDTPPFPWQNRGTFHQVVRVAGHR